MKSSPDHPATAWEKLARTWEELGAQDPLWAVVSLPDKRGGRWDLAEFMETGEEEVACYHALIARHVPRDNPFSHVLDFGCGVGRLTCAWSKRAREATGVDISESMLAFARKHAAGLGNVNFFLNRHQDLGLFRDAEFDLVFSLICLQHMPWPFAQGYLREFGRVCQPGGVVAFQLPSRKLNPNRTAKVRKWIIEHLPFGLGRHYRRWRHGSAAVFDMYYTPSSTVEAVARSSGLELVHREPNDSAGRDTEGFFYIFKKPGK
ncbi:MAG: methyltransferase domain-containing protein [Verrucomicrobiota bacterium]|nr:methyltransferase domain-containing protein [Verrucomicrobiota bacterium]